MNVEKQSLNCCLLIDDDADDREIFCDVMLQHFSDVKCFTASGCSEAFELLQEIDSKPCAIFLDLNMPNVDGRQCLRSLKNNNATTDIPVIIYSTSSQQKDIVETKKLGATDYITKQADLNKLAERLKNYFS